MNHEQITNNLCFYVIYNKTQNSYMQAGYLFNTKLIERAHRFTTEDYARHIIDYNFSRYQKDTIVAVRVNTQIVQTTELT